MILAAKCYCVHQLLGAAGMGVFLGIALTVVVLSLCRPVRSWLFGNKEVSKCESD